MSTLATFSPDLETLARFDPWLNPLAWFDEDLIGAATPAPPPPLTVSALWRVLVLSRDRNADVAERRYTAAVSDGPRVVVVNPRNWKVDV